MWYKQIAGLESPSSDVNAIMPHPVTMKLKPRWPLVTRHCLSFDNLLRAEVNADIVDVRQAASAPAP